MDSGIDVAADMKFWFHIPGSKKNLSQSLTFGELWNRTKGGNALHWYWRCGSTVLKDYDGSPWGLDYQQEIRRLQIHAKPQVMLDFTSDPDDLELGLSQPPHLTESLFGAFEDVDYNLQRIPDEEKNLWRLLRKFFNPSKLSLSEISRKNGIAKLRLKYILVFALVDWNWTHASLQQPLHQSIPTVAQALAEVMRKMQDFQDTRKIAWRKTWWETLHLLEAEMGGLRFAFGSTESPFTKILVELHRVLKIIEPGRPPSELKSPFIERLMEQVAALTNIGASLTKSRKLSKEELKIQGRLQWARGARDRLLTKQKTMGLPPPSFTNAKDGNGDEKRI